MTIRLQMLDSFNYVNVDSQGRCHGVSCSHDLIQAKTHGVVRVVEICIVIF